MSDFLTHECGIAAIRLLKPLEYFQDKYGTSLWALNKLFLLMEKQHNRGQDGIGIGCAKLNMPLGQPYMFRRRDARRDALASVFRKEFKRANKMARKGQIDLDNPADVKAKLDFGGEVLVGHLRYGTSGEFDEGSCHPYIRRTNWPTRTLMVMGNFNMTNTPELNRKLIERGQHPVFGTDTQTVLEEIGFHLDEAHTDIYRRLRDEGVPGNKTQELISQEIDLASIVTEAASNWDGGYAISGVVGNGDYFFMRDPLGIRPCHYLQTDEFIAVASERVPLMTVFEQNRDDVRELEPGALITVKKDGTVSKTRFAEKCEPKPCSFERIYFSRGNDPDIYQERKAMGAALVPQVMKSIDNDLGNAVISFIPNTAETAWYGLMDGLRLHRRQEVREKLTAAIANGGVDEALLDETIMGNWPRGEKIAHKDIKMRTFISQESGRAQLVSHVYDITYDVVGPKDTLVALDDSIVRGTTLEKSILRILARTNPKKIVIASTAPQIRYPDCYGIDMSQLGKFIAFRAAVSLIRKHGKAQLFQDVYDACKAEVKKDPKDQENLVKRIYKPFTAEEVSEEISEIVSPTDIDCEVDVIFQTIEDLHGAIDGPVGDWYFTGDYPTPGGANLVNLAYIHWFEGRDGRAYDTLI